MSAESDRRAAEFLAIADQFKLGVLVTEASHPVTARLSEVARESVEEALDLLFRVDEDVLERYRRWVADGETEPVAQTVLDALHAGKRVFFTGCGSTGRLSILLDSIWRGFWQEQRARGLQCSPGPEEWEDRTRSAMAGGDFALIKAVEGFEDFTQFGRQQIADMGFSEGDVLFAITEGGETSWVIGTAWEALDRGGKVFFVYNNPDSVLCEHVTRSREVIECDRITKINLTTGPMAITGSTRMQATTIELCAVLTVLEVVLRSLMRELGHRQAQPPTSEGELSLDPDSAPQEFLTALEAMLATLRSQPVRRSLARLVELEEGVYRSGHKNTYFADGLGVDMLTDTTERSPTYCTPPFRRYDDTEAAESWAFLCVPSPTTEQAWPALLKRMPRCVHWSEDLVRTLTPPDRADRTVAIVRSIGLSDLFRFRIGQDGLPFRVLGDGDCAVGLVGPDEHALLEEGGFVRTQLDAARSRGAATAVIQMIREDAASAAGQTRSEELVVRVPVPATDLLLDGVTRVGVKMLLNALSTCTMVRLGRVMGNTMIWVVASNLKLIDRATRYIARLADMPYEDACRLLFSSIEYVTPRMAADKAYPPVVGLSVMRARHNLSPEEAEQRLWAELGM
jgi:N-acetylmuramic acid 6-phosphate etherase